MFFILDMSKITFLTHKKYGDKYASNYTSFIASFKCNCNFNPPVMSNDTYLTVKYIVIAWCLLIVIFDLCEFIKGIYLICNKSVYNPRSTPRGLKKLVSLRIPCRISQFALVFFVLMVQIYGLLCYHDCSQDEDIKLDYFNLVMYALSVTACKYLFHFVMKILH